MNSLRPTPLAASLSLLLLQLLACESLGQDNSNIGDAWWGQEGQNSQKSRVSLSSTFLDDNSMMHSPFTTFSQSVGSTVQQMVIDETGDVLLFTQENGCLQFSASSAVITQCPFEGQSLVLGSQGLVFTAKPGVLTRYTYGALDLVVNNKNVTRVVAIDSFNRIFTTGGSVTVLDTNLNVTTSFETATEQAQLALSLAEDVIYFQTSSEEMEARHILTGDLLWSHVFTNPIESIQVTSFGIVVGTRGHLDLLEAISGESVAPLGSLEYINSQVLYEDRIVFTRDNSLSAITFDPAFRVVFTIEGQFTDQSFGCGASDLFVVSTGPELQAFSRKDGDSLWTYTLDEAPAVMVVGNATLFTVSASGVFVQIRMTPLAVQPSFPLWFLGWILPLIALFLLFIFFVHRWNSRKAYITIQ
jgi:hypothetical protein